MRNWKSELNNKIKLYIKMGWAIKESMLEDFVHEWGQRGVRATEIWPYIDELRLMYQW